MKRQGSMEQDGGRGPQWARIVAHVHGQMNEIESKDFAAQVASDAQLQAEFDSFRKWHEQMRDALNDELRTDDELEKRLLLAWERDVGAPASFVHSPAVPAALHWRAFAGIAGLLAFALIVLFHHEGLRMPAARERKEEWRGANQQQPTMTRERRDRLDRLVTRSLAGALRAIPRAQRKSMGRWRLEREYLALPGEAFRLDITLLRDSESVPVQSWSEVFLNESLFTNRMDDLAQRVAEDVARQLSGAGPP